MEKNLSSLNKRVEDIENQLIPMLSAPPNPLATPFEEDQITVERLHQNLNFIGTLISVEMASSSAPNLTQSKNRRLAILGRKVNLLLSSTLTWARGRGRNATPTNNSGDSSSPSVIESCVTDNDDNYEADRGGGGEFRMEGFKVFENPEFDGDFGDINEYGFDESTTEPDVLVPYVRVSRVEDNNNDNDDQIDWGRDEMVPLVRSIEEENDSDDEIGEVDDYQDGLGQFERDEDIKDDLEERNNHEDEVVQCEEKDLTRIRDRDELGEQGFVKENVTVDYEDDNSREASKKSGRCGCFKTLVLGTLVGMGMFLLKDCFPDFADQHSDALPSPT